MQSFNSLVVLQLSSQPVLLLSMCNFLPKHPDNMCILGTINIPWLVFFVFFAFQNLCLVSDHVWLLAGAELRICGRSQSRGEKFSSQRFQMVFLRLKQSFFFFDQTKVHCTKILLSKDLRIGERGCMWGGVMIHSSIFS